MRKALFYRTLFVLTGVAIGAAGASAIFFGAGWMSIDRPAVQMPVTEVGQSGHWMLTRRGSVVHGQKFESETACDVARRNYVDATEEQEVARVDGTWGERGVTVREQPYYQADVVLAQERISEAEATYCARYQD